MPRPQIIKRDIWDTRNLIITVANSIYGKPRGPNEGDFSFRILISKRCQRVLGYSDSLMGTNYSEKKFKHELKSRQTNKYGPLRHFKII